MHGLWHGLDALHTQSSLCHDKIHTDHKREMQVSSLQEQLCNARGNTGKDMSQRSNVAREVPWEPEIHLEFEARCCCPHLVNAGTYTKKY